MRKFYQFIKKDDKILNNYRPISLLPVLSKVFEKVVYNQLYDYFTLHNLLYNSQHGFKRLHSTETATLEFIDRIYKVLDSGELPITVFLDLSKAFDTLDHGILLQKLKHYGVTGISLKWFESYLMNRSQYVQLDSGYSNPLHITTGVPQGSILGPLLFIIYINDLYLASPKFESILYADDTTLISSLCTFNYSLSSNNDVSNNINLELNKVHDWLVANKLSLNIPKTKFMVFSFSQSRTEINLNLKLDNTDIERTSEFNFLGLIVNENLNWNAHIHKIENKLARVVGIFKRLHSSLPPDALLLIYNALFLPHINYSILAWGLSCKRISTLQKSAIRLMCSATFRAHTEPLFKKLKILKVSDLLYLKALKFYFRYTKNDLPRYFTNMFSALPVTHPYPTRYRNVPRYATPLHASVQKCVRHYIPSLLNDAPSNITDKIYTHSYYGFSNYVKSTILSQYSEMCTITNCYICNN